MSYTQAFGLRVNQKPSLAVKLISKSFS